ncbi:MAG: FKBP-type peptidyl-prolyl cis-trans isomerase [Bacteroidales bacterium]
MKITAGKFVACTYELKVGEDQELMEKATTEVPLTFVYGLGQMLDSFESKLAGLELGSSFDFVIPADEAYGQYDEEHIMDLPKDMFVVEGKFDEEVIVPGNIIPMMGADGERYNAQVVEVKEDTVSLDFNHPLAGEDLHFIGEVIEVRDATAEEIMPQGNGCGGGCSSCGCSDEDGEEHGCGSGCNC